MILGKDVRLRAIEREDIPRFVRWMNDPDVIQFLPLKSRNAFFRFFPEQSSCVLGIAIAVQCVDGKMEHGAVRVPFSIVSAAVDSSDSGSSGSSLSINSLMVSVPG